MTRDAKVTGSPLCLYCCPVRGEGRGGKGKRVRRKKGKGKIRKDGRGKENISERDMWENGEKTMEKIVRRII